MVVVTATLDITQASPKENVAMSRISVDPNNATGNLLRLSLSTLYREVRLLALTVTSSAPATIHVPLELESCTLAHRRGSTNISPHIIPVGTLRSISTASGDPGDWGQQFTRDDLIMLGIMYPNDQIDILVPAADEDASPVGVYEVAAKFQIVKW